MFTEDFWISKVLVTSYSINMGNQQRKIISVASASCSTLKKVEDRCICASSPSQSSNIDTFTNINCSKRNSMSNINNGVIGKYLSKRLVSVATTFWFECVECSSAEDRLEIACSIFFSMLSTNKEMTDLMLRNLSSHIKLETTSLKYLEMLTWLLRSLIRDDIDLYSLLIKLGKLHSKIGVKLKHFNIMIESLHETMQYYFTKQYNIDVQYAMEEIITLAARIMTGDITENNNENNDNNNMHSKITVNENHITNYQHYHRRRTTAFHGVNTIFLQSLEVCLESVIGREYFYRYLHQNWCSELTVYLELIQKFKSQKYDKQRYIVAKDLINECISTNSKFAINISYETRTDLLDSFHKLNDKWLTSQMPIDYFKNVEIEVRRLIITNHWKQFVYSVGELHNSANIEYLLCN
eukprot:2152_1